MYQYPIKWIYVATQIYHRPKNVSHVPILQQFCGPWTLVAFPVALPSIFGNWYDLKF